MIDLRKMLLDRAAQGIGTSGGLFGTTNTEGQTTGLLGGLQNINPNLLIGANIIGSGIKGTDPFSSIFPAVGQAAQLQKYLTPKSEKPFEAKDTTTGKNVFITNRQFASDPGRFVPKGEDTGKIQRNQTETLQKLFVNNPITKDFNTATTQYEKLLSSSKQKSAAGDMSMIFTYMKILDPTSVVREGEQATAKQAGAVPDKILNLYNKAVTGQKLTKDQRADFVSTGTKLYDVNLKQLDAFKSSFLPSLDQYSIEPNKVFLSSDLRPKQVKTADGEILDSSKARIIDYDSATGSIVYQLPNGQQFKIKK